MAVSDAAIDGCSRIVRNFVELEAVIFLGTGFNTVGAGCPQQPWDLALGS